MGNDWRLRTKIPIRSSRKIAIEGTNTSCDGDKTHQTTQKSSQASKRPESACLQLPNDRRAAQYSRPLFIVGQPVPSSETPTPERHRVTPRLYQGMPAARVVPERPTARQRGDSKRRQRTGHTLSALEVWPESHWPGFALRQALAGFRTTYYSRIRRDSVCNTFQDPIVTSVIDAKKITAWGESGFPARFLGTRAHLYQPPGHRRGD